MEGYDSVAATQEPAVLEQFRVVGKRIPAKDFRAKVKGQAIYTYDFELPGMLYAKILRSPYAHAKVLSVDASAAERLTGVKAVLSKNNSPRVLVPTEFGGPLDKILFGDKVRFAGEEVAAVAATTPSIAEAALELIKVEYEELPCVLDPERALGPEAVLVHEETGSNVAIPMEFAYGDVKAGLDEAAVVVDEIFHTTSQLHSCMEPHVAIASFNADGSVTVWSSTQVPFHLREMLARYLGLTMSKVRIIKLTVGGGFGSKTDMVIEHIPALLSRETGRPVKLALTREEEFVGSRTRHASVIHMKVGAKASGDLTAIQVKAITDAGAYANQAHTVLGVLGAACTGTYRWPSCSFEGTAVYTNHPVPGAFRGYGNPQAHFALESAIDLLAERLGIDPVELRLKTYKDTGDIGLLPGVPIASCEIRECLRIGAEKIDWWEKRRPTPAAPVVTGRARGMGVACFTHLSGARPLLPDFSSAIVKVNEDGTALILVGSADIGTGSDTTLAQVAAEELGLSVDDVSLAQVDTDAVPFDEGAYSSRTMYVTGTAVKAAAADVKEQLRTKAAELMGVSPEEIDLADGVARIKGLPEKAMTIREIAEQASLAASGGSTFIGVARIENPASSPPFGANFAEVEVDADTGVVELIRMVAVHDVGRAVNPIKVESQMQGGLVQGIGWTLIENPIFDEKGRMVNPNFSNYLIPTILDVPGVDVSWIDAEDPTGPFGAKGLGETSMVAPAAAIANAIRNAVGIQFKDLPITSERVWAALHE